MIATCSKCSHLYEGSDAEARQPWRVCGRCLSISNLLGVIDEFVVWRKATEVVSGSPGADRLSGLLDKLIDRADRIAAELRAP